MTDTYHIQISVYSKADTKYGAEAYAKTVKSNIEFCARNSDSLDEVIIDSVIREDSSKNHEWAESTEK